MPASFSFSVDATDGVYGSPGTEQLLGSVAVDPALLGRTCTVAIDVHNNESRREGTDLIIDAGGAPALIASNVEAVAGDAPRAVLGQLVMGEQVRASVRFGPTGEASVGATIAVDCPDVPNPTVQPDVSGVEVSRAPPLEAVSVQPALTG